MSIIVDLTKGIYRRIYSKALSGRRINSVPLGAEVLFWRLHLVCDDFGNFEADSAAVKTDAFPRRQVSLRDVVRWLGDLSETDPPLVRLYSVEGRKYGHIVGFMLRQPGGRNGKRFRRHPGAPDPTDSVYPGESGCIQVHPEKSGCKLGNPGAHDHAHTDTDSDTDNDNDIHSDTDTDNEAEHVQTGTGQCARARRPKPEPDRESESDLPAEAKSVSTTVAKALLRRCPTMTDTQFAPIRKGIARLTKASDWNRCSVDFVDEVHGLMNDAEVREPIKLTQKKLTDLLRGRGLHS